MLKKITWGLIICAVLLTAGRMLLAEVVSRDAQTGVSLVANNQEVGNKICPVTGEKIDEKEKVTYEYQGKIYNFCCSACPIEFKKDPDKYIKIIGKEMENKTTGVEK